jgi:hypothetical protein
MRGSVGKEPYFTMGRPAGGDKKTAESLARRRAKSLRQALRRGPQEKKGRLETEAASKP